MNKYDDDVMVIANNRTVVDQCDVITREMCQMIIAMINYRYALQHGNLNIGTVREDEINKLKNNISIVGSDIDIFMDILNVTNDVIYKKKKRIEKMARKIKEVD